jgi:hypothetical protein
MVVSKEKRIMKQNNSPKGQDEERVKRILAPCENQTYNETVAKDDSA